MNVMLVTSRKTLRWVLPKGWADVGVAPHDLAAREAFEEAGLIGEVMPDAVGEFTYEKNLENNQAVLCKVSVYPFWVAGSWKHGPSSTSARPGGYPR